MKSYIFRYAIPLLAILIFPNFTTEKYMTGNNDPPLSHVNTGHVGVWLSNSDKSFQLAEVDPVDFSDHKGDLEILINPAIRFQEIDGFGAALTGSSAYILQQTLTTSERDKILVELFDPEWGIGISNLRISIGSSDFSIGNYTYCDTPGIENFRIPEMDSRDLIPVLQKILEISPEIKIIASPWSPPAWMKTINSLNGGKLNTGAYAEFAGYFVKFINAMEDNGIPIYSITIQNEPFNETSSYPSMYMSWTEQNDFIKNNLGPAFSLHNIHSQVWVYDHNWDHPEYATNILDDPVSHEYVTGSAFHAYGGDVSAMTTVHDAHPDRDLYFTEISGGAWATDYWGNIKWNMENIFMGSTKNWSKNAIMWNLVLNDEYGPRNGGCSNCRGVITLSGKGITRNEEYYSIGHFSKFVRPGAKRISSTSATTSLNYVAFQNSDNSMVLVVINSGEVNKTINVKSPSGNFKYDMGGKILATFVWN